MGDGQRAEDQGIDQAEDRGIRPDAESEREHNDRGEAGILGDLPKGVFEV